MHDANANTARRGNALGAALVVLALLGLAGCAHTNGDRDPLEPVNRKVHAFNNTVDRWVLRPVAKGYIFVTPRPVRNGVGNFYGNLLYPTVIINQFLQGKARTGVRDTGRFLINSTVGLLGVVDVAAGIGLHRHREDFGQTFAVWGAPLGAYLVLPLLGPSSIRDGAGSLAGVYTYPVTYIDLDRAERWSLAGLRAIELRAGLLESDILMIGDDYQVIRDAYLQRRSFLIRDGEPAETDPFLQP